MLYDLDTAEQLKAWLIKTLEPICDADPDVLTDYVVALLQHEAPEQELREMLKSQLLDFLEQESAPFVDLLLSTLQNKSYLTSAPSISSSAPTNPAMQPTTAGSSHPPPTAPAAMQQHQDAEIPIPIPTEPRGRKRGFEMDDHHNSRAKGPRLSDEHSVRHHPYANGRPPRGPQQQDGMSGQGRGPGRKGICFNYHNHGYCPRGASCPYTHGEEASVLPQNMMNMMPQAGVMPPFTREMMAMMLPQMMMNANGGYDPSRPQMDFKNGQRRPGPRKPMDRDGDSVMVDMTPNQVVQPIFTNGPNRENKDAMDGVVGGSSDSPMDGGSGGPSNGGGLTNNGFQRGGFGRGGARQQNGTFQGGSTNFGGDDENKGKTLVVEKIPLEFLNLAAVNDWFKKFGTVTNVAIDARGSKALVSFTTNKEAYSAWKSEDAVFGNRFVKVFWHRPMDGQGAAGAKKLAASAGLIQNLANPPPTSNAILSGPNTSTAPKPPSNNLLLTRIQEQKALLEKAATATGDEKKEIMARLRQLNEEIKPPTKLKNKEEREKELLDKELEMHAEGEGSADTKTALQAQLDKLRAEATSLGIDPNAPTTSYPSSRGFVPRGRGRGRGWAPSARGRGGFAKPGFSSMKLDLRPKKLAITGVDTGDESKVTAIREWYQFTPDFEAFTDGPNGEIIASFKTRGSAEQALAKGTNIPGVGTAQITWFAEQPTVPSTIVAKADTTQDQPLPDFNSSGAFATGDEFDAPGFDDQALGWE